MRLKHIVSDGFFPGCWFFFDLVLSLVLDLVLGLVLLPF